ncbi:MAG: DUF2066 domain-containing protein [Bdellovibrionales bacterium]|nr:DUF2066 domain-containing protein [Bdellovibrionales bacterium]
MNSRVLCVLILHLLFTYTSLARELSDLNLEISSAKRGGEAKQEAIDQATEEGTRRLTEELLGPEKGAHAWTQAKAKILKNSTRYVVFIKAGTPIDAAEGSKVAVQLRLSPDNLETLLREMGLFAGGSVRVLPLVTVSESKGSKYAWWADAGEEKTLAQDYHKRLFQQLNAQFKGKSVYVLDPMNASFRMSVPAAYRTEGLRREDQALLGQYLKADVVLSGRVDISKVRPEGPEQKIDYHLELWQAKSGRGIAELSRQETAASDVPKVVSAVMDQADKKVFGELATKLAEVAGSGNLNLGVLRVTVNGNLSFRQNNEFKRQLSAVREIRALKERLFEPSRVTYEAETQVNSNDLAKAVQRTHFNGFQVGVDDTPDNGLVLSVRATSAQ